MRKGQDHLWAELGALGEEVTPVVLADVLLVVKTVFGNVLVGDQIQTAPGVKVRLGLFIIGNLDGLVWPVPFKIGGNRLAVKRLHARTGPGNVSRHKKAQR